ncbi:hypothetical protein FCM35_KLT18989 [Carex littledalei]|uniref:Uncharacterized protein n=1 Tax=Carex littledalei TaxID=544730 RepID=A0A833VV24_9POAL|nr:hypothetical protein FCM35_KLT18989 [Carex littledalei]
MGIGIMTHGDTLTETWEASFRGAVRGSMKKGHWLTNFLCAFWHILKQRNARIFRGEHLPLQVLAYRILEESTLWIKFC